MRLKQVKPLVGALAPRIGYAPGDERAADRQRSAQQPWRAWYKTKRWQDLRAFVFKRDGYICQRTGILLGGIDPAPDSPVANHKRPHRGDPALFWDPANVETVSKAVHDRVIQAEERALPRG